jgi:hypothetical protein
MVKGRVCESSDMKCSQCGRTIFVCDGCLDSFNLCDEIDCQGNNHYHLQCINKKNNLTKYHKPSR